MPVSRGKDFETAFKSAINAIPEISVDRLPDPSAGYAGVRNICDFSVYLYPFQYFFECKAIHGNTLNFKSHITEDQWNGLHEKSKLEGVGAGVCVWFIDHDLTVYVPIEQLVALQDAGGKSLNVKQVQNREVDFTEICGQKRRVLFTYYGLHFMADMHYRMFTKWGSKYGERKQ